MIRPDGEPSHDAPGCELALIIAGIVICAVLSIGLGFMVMAIIQGVIK
jgi:hypothetical protein